MPQARGHRRMRPSDRPYYLNGNLVVRSHKKKVGQSLAPPRILIPASTPTASRSHKKAMTNGYASTASSPRANHHSSSAAAASAASAAPSASTPSAASARKRPKDSALVTSIISRLNEIPPVLTRNLDLIQSLDYLNIKRSRPMSKPQRELALLVAQLKEDLAMQTYELLDQHAKELDRYLLTATHVSNDNKPITSSPRSLNMEVDPNEPTYCTCGQVAFGEMVSCDDPNCDKEWFHVQCVGVVKRSDEPWYCPSCKGRHSVAA